GGLVDQVGVLTHAGLVAATVEKVPVQEDLGRAVALLVLHAIEVLAHAGAHARLDGGLVAAFCTLGLGLGGSQVLDGGADAGVLGQGLVDGVDVGGQDALGQLGVDRSRTGRRQVTDDAQVAGADVVQVGLLGCQVGLGQSQAGVGLFGIDAAAHAGLELSLQLVKCVFVLDVVVFGQAHELAVALDVQ